MPQDLSGKTYGEPPGATDSIGPSLDREIKRAELALLRAQLDTHHEIQATLRPIRKFLETFQGRLDAIGDEVVEVARREALKRD